MLFHIANLFVWIVPTVHSFSSSSGGSSSFLGGGSSSNSGGAGAGAGGWSLLDRFRATCPADMASIRHFFETSAAVSSPANNEPFELYQDATWVAVYRTSSSSSSSSWSSSAVIREDFFQAMDLATMTQPQSARNFNDTNQPLIMALEQPVAVARLRPSDDFPFVHVLDCIRCRLRKEDQDETCDGGSEFCEALAVGIDTLLLHYLRHTKNNPQYDNDAMPVVQGRIRSKATLFSSKILEDRGFVPLKELSKDMATHYSTYDSCLEKYADRTTRRSINQNPGARDRSLQIVALLAQLDRGVEMDAASNGSNDDEDTAENDEYDPWANIKMNL